MEMMRCRTRQSQFIRIELPIKSIAAITVRTAECISILHADGLNDVCLISANKRHLSKINIAQVRLKLRQSADAPVLSVYSGILIFVLYIILLNILDKNHLHCANLRIRGAVHKWASGDSLANPI